MAVSSRGGALASPQPPPALGGDTSLLCFSAVTFNPHGGWWMLYFWS